MIKLRYIIPLSIIFLLLAVLSYKFCFLRIKISEDLYIQQKPFTRNYYLKSHDKGKIIEFVYEWKDVDKYVYGSSYQDNTFYYIYEKENNKLQVFEDLHSFYIKLDSLNLVYTMDNCSRILDYKRIN